MAASELVFGSALDLGAQVGRSPEQKPMLRISADRELRLSARFAVEGPGPQRAAIGAGTIPLRQGAAGRAAENMDTNQPKFSR